MIEIKLLKLRSDKSPGSDGISSPKQLQEVQRELTEPLAIIFLKPLNVGVVPSTLKNATICLIYKTRSPPIGWARQNATSQKHRQSRRGRYIRSLLSNFEKMPTGDVISGMTVD